MREVPAYLCEHTNHIFATAAEARRSEFLTMMRRAADHFPPGERITTVQDSLAQLANYLVPPTSYLLAVAELRAALDYLHEHQGEM